MSTNASKELFGARYLSTGAAATARGLICTRNFVCSNLKGRHVLEWTPNAVGIEASMDLTGDLGSHTYAVANVNTFEFLSIKHYVIYYYLLPLKFSSANSFHTVFS